MRNIGIAIIDDESLESNLLWRGKSMAMRL